MTEEIKASKEKKLIQLCLGVSFITALVQYSGYKLGVYILKPLPMTILIITALYLKKKSENKTYSNLLIWGFVFSLFGDIFLMLPSDQFVAGLASFLLGHVCYAVAFNKKRKSAFNLLTILLISSYGIIFFLMFLPSLGALLIPVIVYMTVICFMMITAINMYLGDKNTLNKNGALGAFLFVISDTFLGINKFTFPFEESSLVVLPFYFTGQVFICMSIADINRNSD